MILKSDIEDAVALQKVTLKKRAAGVDRESFHKLQETTFITIVTGIRRCGKSTLLRQVMQKEHSGYGFFNFEDPRIFGFEVNDFPKLADVLGEVSVYFFDEIQNIDNWEIFIRDLHDQEKRIYITGSNASLLSKELGTRLTGRHLQVELFPFSFKEYLTFSKQTNNEKSFNDYLEHGGFPEYLKTKNREVLQQLFKDIVYRDIVVRYGVRNADQMVNLALYMISNVGKEYSLNRLKNSFQIGSVSSVSDYVSWLEDAYLLFSLPKFSWSAKSISVNPKKAYTIDSGFASANSLSYSNDSGRLLENMVFIHLRKRHKELYYFRDKYECDFIVKELNKVTQALQVCVEVNRDNMEREVKGLLEALHFFNLPEGIIVTLHQEDQLSEEGKEIQLIPAWKWFTI